MNSAYFKPVTKPFLKNIEFSSPNTPELFFHAQSGKLEINNNVESRRAEGTSLYLVDLQSTMVSKTDDVVIFNAKITYSTMIEITEADLSEEVIKQILNIDVPEILYDYNRARIFDMIERTGLPPYMMRDFDRTMRNAITTQSSEESKTDNVSFDKDEDNDNSIAFLKFLEENEKDEESAIEEGSELPQENIFPLGYEWIMEDIRLVEDGAGVSFLETAKNYLEKDGKSTGNELLTYEENPLYKYYYRFLTPIEYSHPDYGECEDSYWPMLFQLLFGEGKNVKVIDGDNGLPEIEFDYCEDERRTVSSLTLEELKFITSELAVKAFTDTLVEILGYDKQMDNDYADILRGDQLILKEEFHALYNIDQPNASAEDIAFVDRLYARIKECDLQTFSYKF